MAQPPINIPDFMKEYYEGSNPEGKARLETIAANYEKQRQEFMQNIYPGKAIFQDDWNRLTGQNKRLDPDKLTWHIREEHRAEAEKVAKQSGYVDKAAQQKEAKAQPSAQTKQKPQPMNTQTQQPAGTVNETPKQQATQQAAQPDRREAFLQAIQQQRQRQAQARQTQQAAPPPAPAAPAAGEQGNRERTLAQLKAMREQSQQMTQKPR